MSTQKMTCFQSVTFPSGSRRERIRRHCESCSVISGLQCQRFSLKPFRCVSFLIVATRRRPRRRTSRFGQGCERSRQLARLIYRRKYLGEIVRPGRTARGMNQTQQKHANNDAAFQNVSSLSCGVEWGKPKGPFAELK